MGAKGTERMDVDFIPKAWEDSNIVLVGQIRLDDGKMQGNKKQ